MENPTCFRAFYTEKYKYEYHNKEYHLSKTPDLYNAMKNNTEIWERLETFVCDNNHSIMTETMSGALICYHGGIVHDKIYCRST